MAGDLAFNGDSKMTFQGVVQNGVILVEGGVRLPEGAEVQIELTQPTIDQSELNAEPTIGQKLAELAKKYESLPCDLPHDLAINHDHYLHGQPKRQ